MNTFLTRISTRAREVLNSLGDEEVVSARILFSTIDSVGGMGSKIIQLHPNLLKSDSDKSVNLGDVVEDAFFVAIRMGHTYVGTEHLLLAGLGKSGYKDLQMINSEVERLNSLPVLLKNANGITRMPFIHAFGIDLTKKYIFYPKELFVEREEVSKIFKILLQKNNANVLLLGEKGAGKRSIVEAISRKISYLDVPAFFVGMCVVDFNMQAFISSISASNDSFDNAVKNLAGEVKLLGKCIMVINHLSGNSGSVFRGFVDTLNDAGAKVIVSLDSASYDKATSVYEDMFYGFAVVEVKEPSSKAILDILKMEAKKLEDYFVLKIPLEVIDYVFKKAKTEIKDQPFPQKAIDLLDKACSFAAFTETKVPKPLKSMVEKHVDLSVRLEQAFLDKDYDKAVEVAKSVKGLEKRISGMPVLSSAKLRQVDIADVDQVLREYKEEEAKEYKIGTKTLADLESRIKQRIVGQDKAVEIVTKALIRSQMGLRPKNKPVGNFLFLGPTGVGKTELAKVLAQEAFGDDSLIRLDMSDFGEKHTVSRLVGAPPGYVGYNEGGELTTKISQKPQSVVLFDEVEKAHPEVLNILLQIMEEGQLSDMRGDVYNFSSAVVILTSNLGTDAIHKREIGYGGAVKSQKEIEERVQQSVKTFLKPELLNRFDETVTFRQLEKQDSKEILNLLLKEVHTSLAEKGVKLTIDASVKDYLLEKGFSVEFGARALRRTVEKELLDRIAGFMLSNKSAKKKTAKNIRAKLSRGGVVIV